MNLKNSINIYLFSLAAAVMITSCGNERPKPKTIQLDSAAMTVETFLFEEDSVGTKLTIYGKFKNKGAQPYIIDTTSLILENGAKARYSFSECHPYKVKDSSDFFMIYNLPPRQSSAHYFIMYVKKNGKPVSDTLKFYKSYRSEG